MKLKGMQLKGNEKGFTLIELMIVIDIIGVQDAIFAHRCSPEYKTISGVVTTTPKIDDGATELNLAIGNVYWEIDFSYYEPVLIKGECLTVRATTYDFDYDGRVVENAIVVSHGMCPPQEDDSYDD